MDNKKIENGCLIVIIGVIFGLILLFIEAAVVMMLWNTTLVLLFNLPALTYWAACGILILANILFKGTNLISNIGDVVNED